MLMASDSPADPPADPPANSSANPPADCPEIQCQDFQAFQLQLKNLRFVDDRIVNELNSEIVRHPDPSAKCLELHRLILSTHQIRDSSIKKCIKKTASDINDIKVKRDAEEEAIFEMRRVQRRLQLFQKELNIEEIVKERTLKAFKERCRFHYDVDL